MREGVVARMPIRQAAAPAICPFLCRQPTQGLAAVAGTDAQDSFAANRTGVFGQTGRNPRNVPLAFATIVEQQRFLQQFDFALVMLIHIVEQRAEIAAHFVKTWLFPFADIVQLGN